MTRSIFAILALALAMTMPALTQNTTQAPAQTNPNMGQSPGQNSQPMQQPNAAQAPSTQVPTTSAGTSSESAQKLSGTISADGKTFTSTGGTYNISNPNSVKAYANQPITVEYEMDSNNSIHITKLMLPNPQR